MRAVQYLLVRIVKLSKVLVENNQKFQCLIAASFLCVSSAFDVYRKLADSVGYLEKIETRWKMEEMLMSLREELKFGEEDAWNYKVNI